MSKEVTELTKEKLINMSETDPTKSILCDDKGLLLENQKDPHDLSTSKKYVETNTGIKENCDEEKNTLLDGDFENTKIGEQNEKANIKVKDGQEKEQLMEIDNVEKSIENNAENDIPATINHENDGQIAKNPLANANQKHNDNGKNENNFTDDKKINENKEKTMYHSANKINLGIAKHIVDYNGLISKDVEQNSINEDEGNKNTAENDKIEKDIKKLKEIDNVSNGENHLENDIPMRMGDENVDNTQVVENPLENTNIKENNNGDKEKTFSDVEKSIINENEKKTISHNAEELELKVNLIEDALMPKDNEQKCKDDADKNADEESIIYIDSDNSDEEITDIKDKNFLKFQTIIDLTTESDDNCVEVIQKNEEKPSDNVDEQEVDLAKSNGNSEEVIQKNEEKPADNVDEQEVDLAKTKANLEEDIQKNEEKPADKVDEPEVDLAMANSYSEEVIQKNEEKPADNVDDPEVDLAKSNGNSEEVIQKNEEKHLDNVDEQEVDLAKTKANLEEDIQKNEEKPADKVDEQVELAKDNGNSEEDITKKRKNVNEEKPADNVDEQVELAKGSGNSDEDTTKKRKNVNEEKPADNVDEQVELAKGSGNSDEDTTKKRKNVNEEKPADNVDEQVELAKGSGNSDEDTTKKRKNENQEKPEDNLDQQEEDLIEGSDNPGKCIHKKRKVN